MNETEKLIEEQFKTLPPNLQQAINTAPWKTLVQKIGKANNLNPEQIASFEQETMFIIYGFENHNDYISNIIKNVGIPEDVTYVIAESVADQIFDPILKKSEGSEKPVGTKSESTTSASVPGIPPDNLPVVEPPFAQATVATQKGEVAHTVDSKQETVDREKQIPSQTKAPLPDYRYPEGNDPYREPTK